MLGAGQFVAALLAGGLRTLPAELEVLLGVTSPPPVVTQKHLGLYPALIEIHPPLLVGQGVPAAGRQQGTTKHFQKIMKTKITNKQSTNQTLVQPVEDSFSRHTSSPEGGISSPVPGQKCKLVSPLLQDRY